MRKRVGLPLLGVIAGLFIAIAHYEQQSEAVTPAPTESRTQAAAGAEPIEAPAGFSQANWVVDGVDDTEDPRMRVDEDRPAERKEPTWIGSEIILPVK